MTIQTEILPAAVPATKFSDPDWTAKGEKRASVGLDRLTTLWINTGSLCNITCRNCYIESSPSNDRLEYITAAEAAVFLDEAKALGTREIGFTGGEPFLNPEFPQMLSDALARGFEVLLLTNAMLPMQRPHIKKSLIALNGLYSRQLTVRVSLDHYTKVLHEIERGPDTFERTLAGIDWLSANAFNVAIAGRMCWDEAEDAERQGYGSLIAARNHEVEERQLRVQLFQPLEVLDQSVDEAPHFGRQAGRQAGGGGPCLPKFAKLPTLAG